MASIHHSPPARSNSLEDEKNENAGSEMVETVSHVHEGVEEGAWASAKKNPKVILYSTASCVSSMLWGFDIGVNSISVALPAFKMVFGYEYEGELLISATWNALWTAMTSLGMLIGSIICGWVSDRGGRRLGFGMGSVISLLGVGLEYAAKEPGLLLAGKIINGLALGFFLTLGSTYASEIAPTALRPSLTAAVNLFINAGQLMAIGIGNTRFAIMLPSSYKVIFAAQWAFPCFIALLAMFMPESPWYLLRKGQIEQAKKSLQRLHLKATDTTAILEEIQASIAAENAIADIQKDTSYWDCFRGTNWRRTRISCGMFAVQQFTGIAFYAQALYFLGISGLPTALTFQLALGGFGVAMVGNIVSWFIMNYIGRRPLLLTGILLNGLCLMSVGVAGCFTTLAALYYIGYVMNFAHIFYAPTVGAVSWTISAEVSSTNVRAKTQSLAIGTNALVSWAMNFIAPYLINTDEANLGGKAAFVWMALSFLSLVWAWFEVPELKDRTFAELDEIFAQITPTRKFKIVVVDSNSSSKDVSS
ncbi:maltose permease [Penicillium brasilianum]|uniref:Maltose permease n=1 Tax=Penicillium brasilianum TaxID=104259 RepID=A0A1S9RLZ8_PENBI|nr:maltose permease [Penicillium brasilianum]